MKQEKRVQLNPGLPYKKHTGVKFKVETCEVPHFGT